MLYHCLYKEPAGDALLPTCEREEHGRTAPYLYAASHLSKALAFAFSYHDSEVICNGAIEDTPEEFVIVCGGQETLDKPRHIRVYGFSNKGFREIEGHRQWVSEQPVRFTDTRLVLETTDIRDLMRNGLQIFVVKETAEELMAQNFLERFEQMPVMSLLRQLTETGRARWLNREHNTGVSPALQQRFSHPQPGAPCPAFE